MPIEQSIREVVIRSALAFVAEEMHAGRTLLPGTLAIVDVLEEHEFQVLSRSTPETRPRMGSGSSYNEVLGKEQFWPEKSKLRMSRAESRLGYISVINAQVGRAEERPSKVGLTRVK